MPRLIFPEAFDDQRTLLGLIRKKHLEDGANSVLIPLLAQKNIDLDVDFIDGGIAATHDASQKLLMRNAENSVEMRNLKFDTVFSHTRDEVQFLKSFYKPNVHILGSWGVPVTGRGKIDYPAEFEKRVKIVRDIKKKHETFAGNTSPLKPYLTQHNIDLAADADATTKAEEFETKQLADRNASENETQLRDKFWKTPLEHLHDIGDYLMKLFKGEAKQVGLWGFTVDDSPRAPKERTSTVKISSQITVNNIVIGGTLTNIGKVLLHIYKGKTTIGNPVIVLPNEKLGMAKGNSAITVVNPSTIENGKFKVLRSK